MAVPLSTSGGGQIHLYLSAISLTPTICFGRQRASSLLRPTLMVSSMSFSASLPSFLPSFDPHHQALMPILPSNPAGLAGSKSVSVCHGYVALGFHLYIYPSPVRYWLVVSAGAVIASIWHRRGSSWATLTVERM